MTGTDTVAVGVIGKAFGVHGEVYVHADPDLEVAFDPGLVVATDGQPQRLKVAGSRRHGSRLLVQFEEFADRDTAQQLRGLTLALRRTDLVIPEDTYWIGDLVGREVIDDQGELVGVVEGAVDGLAHDYLVVARPDGGEVLIPAVADLIEISDDRVVVQRLPGLLGS